MSMQLGGSHSATSIICVVHAVHWGPKIVDAVHNMQDGSGVPATGWLSVFQHRNEPLSIFQVVTGRGK